MLFIGLFMVISAFPVSAENDVKIEVLIAEDWGNKVGEFGIEKAGKTEDGYALDFFIAKDSIYILDAINNRVQVFDLKGKFKKIIKLQMKWQDFGLPREMTLFQNNLFFLVGKPPHYSANGIREIYKFTYNGEFIKRFGKEYIPKKREEYFYHLLSNENSAYIICGLGGIKVLAFDGDGNLKDTLREASGKEVVELMGIDVEGNPIISKIILGKKLSQTFLLDTKSKAVKEEIKDIYSWRDKDGNYYFIKTNNLRKKNDLITKIDIYNPTTKLHKNIQMSGDIKTIKNNKEKLFRYQINFTEVAKVDADGNIYHLIALEDGVLLRKITWKN